MILTLPTSFEESNSGKKDLIKQWIFSKVDYSGLDKRQPICLKDNTSFYHVELPSSQTWSPAFKTRVLGALVDEDVKEDLERAGLINWCPNVPMMVPLLVSRDGNCLLHSVATAIWGISDSGLMLRRVLSVVLGIDIGQRFHSRWRHYQQVQLSQFVDRLSGSDPEHLDREWKEITQCLDPDHSRSRAVPHRFLEAIHVYTLANILRRPIIVVTDPTMRTFSGLSLQDNDMGGIYLPLEWSWGNTWHTPVVMSYTHCHFSPLLVVHDGSQVGGMGALVLLVNRRLEQLPVRFLLEGEGPEVGELLRRYLKVKETVMQVDGQLQNILCAERETLTLPEDLSLVRDYFQLYQQQFLQEAGSFPGQVPQYRRGVSSEFGGLSPGGNYQQSFHPGIINQAPGSPGHVEREQLQRMQTNEIGLADPVLSGAWGQSLVQAPPPSFPPRLNFVQPSTSLRSPQDRKCVVPECRFFADPELGMMCSNCFRNYTIRESRHMAAAPAVATVPSAPLASLQGQEEQVLTSMMTERCWDGCGYRCSRETYPYCHECSERRRKLSKQTAEAGGSEAAVTSARSGLAAGGSSPAAAPSSGLPEEGSSPQIASQLNNLSQPSVRSATSPHLPQVTGAAAPQRILETSQTGVTGSAGCRLTESMSPTQVLQSGSLLAPLTPPDEGLFGSGQPFPPPRNPPSSVPHHPTVHIPPSHPKVQTEPQPTQSGGKTGGMVFPSPPVPQPPWPAASPQEGLPAPSPAPRESWAPAFVPGAPVDSCPEACSVKECPGRALFKGVCGKCYVSRGTPNPGLSNPAVKKLKMASLFSMSSSAPASVGQASAGPTFSSPHAQEAEVASSPQGRNRASSLTLLSESGGQSANTLPYVQRLVSEGSRHPEWQQPSGLSGTQPLGLPEKPETEPLGNDLVESGLECSSPPRCVGEGCRNSVQTEGALCEDCKTILRLHRQGQASYTSVQESQQPGQHPCQTEGCPYFGIKDNLNFCTSCYTRLVQHEVDETRHAACPASPNPSSCLSRGNSVPVQYNPAPRLQGQQGEYCCSPGCSKFGDPKQAGMCFAHYQQYLAGFSAPVVHSSAPLASRREEGQGLDSLARQTASLGYQPERNQQRPVQVVDPLTHHPPFLVEQQRAVRSDVQASSHLVSSGGLHMPREERGGGGGVVSRGIPPPSLAPSQPVQLGWEQPSDLLAETYSRVVGGVKCVNPACGNFGNPRNGGVCNSCAQDEKLVHRLIYGEEAIG